MKAPAPVLHACAREIVSTHHLFPGDLVVSHGAAFILADRKVNDCENDPRGCVTFTTVLVDNEQSQIPAAYEPEKWVIQGNRWASWRRIKDPAAVAHFTSVAWAKDPATMAAVAGLQLAEAA
jgi:hypothetical protein